MALTAAWESRGSEQEEGGGVELSCGGEEGRMRREHMFDKVVTPSDVGKLNRLVVPMHFAERHILPRLLGGAAKAACPSAVLRFEDGRGGGKAWAFRFSYWGSSQSYVMTKGWSTFVRDRRLAADTVSFFRAGARLFIDCRRRRSGSLGAGDTPPRSSSGAASRHAHAAAIDVVRRDGTACPVRPAVRRRPRARRHGAAAAGFAANFDEKMT